MTPLLIGLAVLLAGTLAYGWLTAAAVEPDARRITPAHRLADGVDFVALPTWRVYLIQLLNIAGLGPVFGPILGALWGPQVFLWVVLGSLLGGAVHDFLAGVMSVRHDGEGFPALVGRFLGGPARRLTELYVLALMILVGTVFVKGPALLVVKLLPEALWEGTRLGPWARAEWGGLSGWMWAVMALIFIYYLAATLLPIDKLIGRVYPWFAAALLVMVVGIGAHMIANGLDLSAFTLHNLHPQGLSPWPVLFITVSCGAVSGFHATQAPLMARTITSERAMSRVFYGAMIGEAVIALVWGAAAQSYYAGPDALNAVLKAGGPAEVVFDVATRSMGALGGGLAIVGVIVLPITSGDTAFRVARLIAADALGIGQARVRNRYLLAVPLFAAAVALQMVDFSVIWRYFGWMNQTLAVLALWAGAVFLRREGRWPWLAVLPALFMTTMTTSFILTQNDLYTVSIFWSTGAGLAAAALSLALFLWRA